MRDRIIIPPPTLLQLRQRQQRKQACIQHIHLNRLLDPFDRLKNRRVDRRILHPRDPARGLHPVRKGDCRGRAAEIQRPDLNSGGMGFGTCSALDTPQDVRLGRLALVGVADGKDESGAVEPVEVARSFEAETLVGASYDVGLVCELVRGIQWGDEEL
jgi:hypothetical protein